MSKFSATQLSSSDPSVVDFVRGPESAPAKTRSFTIRIEEGSYDLLKRIAKEEDRSIQKTLQRLLIPALEAHGKKTGLL